MRYFNSRQVESIRGLHQRRKAKVSMASLPLLLLLLLWGVGSHGFPAVTSDTQEKDVEMVQVSAEFHMPETQEPLSAFSHGFIEKQ